MSLRSLLTAAILCISAVVLVEPVMAFQVVPPEKRKEMAAISKEMRTISGLVRRKKVEEAEEQLKVIEEKVAGLGVPQTDRQMAVIMRQIAIQKNLIAKQKNGGKPAAATGLSFVKDVAPIIKEKCISCHGARNPRRGLRLDTFAGFEAGGQGGPLLVVGNPNASLLMARLVAPNPQQRMPQGNGAMMTAAQVQTIGLWIAQGAKFDGNAKDGPIDAPKREAVKIDMPTGDETVSFTKDVAPFMANLCVRCHSGNNARSGFSLATFEGLMQGGDSGRVVIPGNLEGSRLWDLVGKQDPIKMPPGQALITRTNWDNLKTWIEEGAKFDGDDPKQPLRDLVPTEAEMAKEALDKLSDEEFAQYRMTETEDLWNRVMNKQRARYVEGKDFLVFGNPSEERLVEVSDWAETQGKALRSLFNAGKEPLFKGRLAIIVVTERFAYEEFNRVVQNREVPKEIVGHSMISDGFKDAYVVLQDIGDEASIDNQGLKSSVIEQITSAYLQRGGAELPNWLVRGFGLSMAQQADPENVYLSSLTDTAVDAVKAVQNPQEVFEDGSFAPSIGAAVGASLVQFMMKSGGPAKFGRFIRALQNGSNVQTAARTVYQADLRVLGAAFITNLAGR